MFLSAFTDGLGAYKFDGMLDVANRLGLEALEIGTGGWSAKPHIDVDLLLKDADERARYLEKLKAHNLEIAALNASGNPLCPGEMGKQHAEDVEKTIRLAGLLGVKTLVLQTGTPGAGPDEKYPMWITCPFPTTLRACLEDYQWNEVGIPYWTRMARMAEENGVEKIAFENFGMNLCYNVDTVLKMRKAVGGTIIGMNLDPSHMFTHGADPIVAARALGMEGALHYIHAKDTRFNEEMAKVNGINFLTDFFDVPPHLRSWNYVAVGYGHDEIWWRRFLAAASMTGYNGAVSLEIEDPTMSALEAHEKSIQVLQNSMPLNRDGGAYKCEL